MIGQTEIIRWDGDASSSLCDDVALERRTAIRCGPYSFTTYCSPREYEDLGVGHTCSEGEVAGGAPKVAVELGEQCDTIIVDKPPEMGMWPEPQSIELRHGDVQRMARLVAGESPLFEKTGAFHYAFVFDASGEAFVSRADIGRFNAIDKAVGHCIREGVALTDKVLFTTGRISGRTVSKAAALGMPAIVSKAPPFYESIRQAQSAGITLVGFARKSSFNVYTAGRAQVK